VRRFLFSGLYFGLSAVYSARGILGGLKRGTAGADIGTIITLYRTFVAKRLFAN
jgi:hypothetical protein